MIRQCLSAAVPEPSPGLFSNCFEAGGVVYVSGQHAGTAEGVVGSGSMLEQAREALRRVVALVTSAGGGAGDIVRLTVYVTDMARKAEVSAARREVFAAPFPCSTLVGVATLGTPDLLVELDAIAVLGTGGRTLS